MRDLPAPVYVSSVRAQGLRPRRGGTTLAMTTCSVLPSVPYDAVGPPNSIFLSRLNTQPTRCPVNASPLPSRTATHDSGPTWFATPWLGGTCTRETYRFVPAHRLVKILERPVGQQVAPFQGLLESGIAVGYVFLPGAQFVACSSPRSRFEPAVRTPGRPVARHPQPRSRKPTLRREIPWILRGFQGRLSC